MAALGSNQLSCHMTKGASFFFFFCILCLLSIQVLMQTFPPLLGRAEREQAVSHDLQGCVQQWNHLALYPIQLLITNKSRTFTRKTGNLRWPTFTLGRIHLQQRTSETWQWPRLFRNHIQHFAGEEARAATRLDDKCSCRCVICERPQLGVGQRVERVGQRGGLFRSVPGAEISLLAQNAHGRTTAFPPHPLKDSQSLYPSQIWPLQINCSEGLLLINKANAYNWAFLFISMIDDEEEYDDEDDEDDSSGLWFYSLNLSNEVAA